MRNGPKVVERLEALRLPELARSGPGYAVGVDVGGGLVWDHAEGARRVGGPPLDVESTFYAGSIAKQVTGCCAAVLAERGVLSVEWPLRHVIPELPESYDGVLVRHLLHHTSGVPAYDPGFPVEVGSLIDSAAALDAACRSGPMLFEPGSQYRYSSTGYMLLAHVVSSVAGVPFEVFAADHVFGPLGMTRSTFRAEPEDASDDDLALGHVAGPDGLPVHVPMAFHVVGDGGLLTCVSDLARWVSVFDGSSPLGPEVAARMLSTSRLNDGSPHFYGWGIAIWTHRGASIQMHDGGAGGYSGKLVRFPQHALTTIVLANHAEVDVNAICRDVSDTALGYELDWTQPSWDDAIAAHH